MTKNIQEKAQFDKINQGINAYNQANNLLENIDWSQIDSDGNVFYDDDKQYNRIDLTLQKDIAKEETQKLIDGYSPFDLQLRDFKTVHPTIDIPWESKKDLEDNSFEDNMIIDKYKVSKEVVDKNRKIWQSAGSEGEFSDWFDKNYKSSDAINPKFATIQTPTIDDEGISTKDIIDEVFNEVENPIDPRNPGSTMKSVKYTTSKKTQATIKDKYGRGALEKLNKLYKLKEKFGEDSSQYKKQFEVFEKYLLKRNKKKQSSSKQSQNIKTGRSGEIIQSLNKQFTPGR
jgi:hypothetical protein